MKDKYYSRKENSSFNPIYEQFLMQLKIWCHALGFIEQMLYLPRILVEGDFIELFKLWHDSWNTELYRYNASMVTSI